jgi:hypothetical protein
LLWGARVLWVATAVAGALSLSQASRHLTTVPHFILVTAWWLAMAAVLLALIVPGPTSLTITRVVAPVALPSVILTWLGGGPAATAATATALAAASAVLLSSAELAELLVQGAAYGDERRLPLRTPAGVKVAATVVWAAWCASTLGAAAALWHRSWALAIFLALIAGALKLLTLTRMQRLSNRWLVLVPAGVVVHDPLVLGETLMVQRSNLRSAALALADTDAADITGPAAGMAIEIAVHEMVTAIFPASQEHPTGRAVHMAAFLVSPSRPGRALRALREPTHRH